ncbi:MAG: MraY family glycosyltransferase [Prolixibacteraceae bacterium]
MVSLSSLATLLTSFVIAWAVIPSIISISRKKKLLDLPNRRKLNKVAVPTMGGVAVFIGLTVGSILFLRDRFMPEWQYLFTAVMLMLCIGLIDDLLVIRAWKKLLVQLGAALILVVMGGFEVTRAYGLMGIDVLNNWFSIPISVLLILFVINAVNLIDGIDGLAAGLSLLVSLALGSWFYLTGNLGYATICMALCGSLAAFLMFNLSPAPKKIFLGDTGSLVLGVFLAAIAIRFNELNAWATSPFRFAQAPLIAMALLIVPVTDTLRVIVVRIRKGRSPFSPDMNHLHHLLIKGGCSHAGAAGWLLAWTIAFVAIALLFNYLRLNISLGFVLMLALSFSAAQGVFTLARLHLKKRMKLELQKLTTGLNGFNGHEHSPLAAGKKYINGNGIKVKIPD